MLDVNELTERADNAIKFLSDMFSARLYKLAASKVGVPDYKDLVKEKLQTAEDLYRFMVDQFNQSRAFVLELNGRSNPDHRIDLLLLPRGGGRVNYLQPRVVGQFFKLTHYPAAPTLAKNARVGHPRFLVSSSRDILLRGRVRHPPVSEDD